MQFSNLLATSFKRNAIVSVSLAVLVLSTASALAYGPYGKPGSSYISEGDRVVLNKKVEVAAGSRIYIQGGKAMPRREIHEASPYCYFSLYRSSAVIETPWSLDPDGFVVSKTSNYYELVQTNAKPYEVALGGLFSQDDSEKTLITRIRISSNSQPEVVGLHCGVWAVASERNHVSLKEIKKALGGLVTLELAINTD